MMKILNKINKTHLNKLYTPEKGVYNFFANDIQELIGEFCEFALIRAFNDDGKWNYEVIHEWNWYNNERELLGNLSNDIYDCNYDEIIENGDGYYLCTTEVEGDMVDNEYNEFYMDYRRYPKLFLKFVSLSEIEIDESIDNDLSLI